MHAQGSCSSDDAYYEGCPQGSEGSFWTWLCVKHPPCCENPFFMSVLSIHSRAKTSLLSQRPLRAFIKP